MRKARHYTPLATLSLGLLAATGCIVDCPKLRWREMPGWIALRASQLGVKIAPPAVQQLMNVVGTNPGALESELEKLAAYRAEVAQRNFMGMRQAATLGADGEHSAKLDRLAELLEDHRESGRKVLVFSYFLDVLEAEGLAGNTIIIFTSDHGDCLGDHGHSQKWTMYDTITRVPAIVWAPGRLEAGRQVDDLVQLMDGFVDFIDSACLFVA